VLGISVSGWSGGDGKITALLGLIGVILAAAWWAAGRAHAVVQIVMGVIVALVGVNDMNDFAAIGLYSTLLAGIGWVIGAVIMLRKPMEASPLVPTSAADRPNTPADLATPDRPAGSARATVCVTGLGP
jgi:hypothetical protein